MESQIIHIKRQLREMHLEKLLRCVDEYGMLKWEEKSF